MQIGPGHIHRDEFCECGNRVGGCECTDSGSKIRVNHKPCHCKSPGPMKYARGKNLSTTKKGMVRKTFDDLEHDMARQERESSHKIAERAKRNRHLGRVVWGD